MNNTPPMLRAHPTYARPPIKRLADDVGGGVTSNINVSHAQQKQLYLASDCTTRPPRCLQKLQRLGPPKFIFTQTSQHDTSTLVHADSVTKAVQHDTIDKTGSVGVSHGVFTENVLQGETNSSCDNQVSQANSKEGGGNTHTTKKAGKPFYSSANVIGESVRTCVSGLQVDYSSDTDTSCDGTQDNQDDDVNNPNYNVNHETKEYSDNEEVDNEEADIQLCVSCDKFIIDRICEGCVNQRTDKADHVCQKYNSVMNECPTCGCCLDNLD